MEIIIGLLIFAICVLIAIVWHLQLKLDMIEWDVGLFESKRQYLENRILILEKKFPQLYLHSGAFDVC